MPSISRSLPENSFHLGSFSKTLTPGLRIGWVRSGVQEIASLTRIKETIDLHSSALDQAILDAYLEERSAYERHLDFLRLHYKKKRDLFAEVLRSELKEFEFLLPQGGMFIYGTLAGYDTHALVYEALKKKVVFVPGSEFYLENGRKDEIRFNYTHANEANIREGIKRIRKSV